jgi:hypothetical protein
LTVLVESLGGRTTSGALPALWYQCVVRGGVAKCLALDPAQVLALYRASLLRRILGERGRREATWMLCALRLPRRAGRRVVIVIRRRLMALSIPRQPARIRVDETTGEEIERP